MELTEKEKRIYVKLVEGGMSPTDALRAVEVVRMEEMESRADEILGGQGGPGVPQQGAYEDVDRGAIQRVDAQLDSARGQHNTLGGLMNVPTDQLMGYDSLMNVRRGM